LKQGNLIPAYSHEVIAFEEEQGAEFQTDESSASAYL